MLDPGLFLIISFFVFLILYKVHVSLWKVIWWREGVEPGIIGSEEISGNRFIMAIIGTLIGLFLWEKLTKSLLLQPAIDQGGRFVIFVFCEMSSMILFDWCLLKKYRKLGRKIWLYRYKKPKE